MKKFNLYFTENSETQLIELKNNQSKQIIYKAVAKTLGLMQVNLRHPSLNTHEYTTLSRQKGYKVFESYAQNHTAGAYRIFWCYGPQNDEITIIAITPHP